MYLLPLSRVLMFCLTKSCMFSVDCFFVFSNKTLVYSLIPVAPLRAVKKKKEIHDHLLEQKLLNATAGVTLDV